MEQTIVIRPKKRLSIDWKELREYRELFFYFAWRDVKVRYKQTAIGIVWAVLQPFIQMVVFTLFFNKVAGIQAGTRQVPYAIFSFIGLLFWNYFSQALQRSANSLVDNQSVVTKVYFPRIIPPISSTVVSLIDFAFAALVFVGLMFFFQFPPTALGLLLTVPAILVTFVAASGIGLFLAAVNVKYRDVKQALPFLVQTGLFLTPVIYPVASIPQQYQWLLYLNPMTGVINAMRSSYLNDNPIDWGLTLLSIVVSVLLFVGGLYYFKGREKEFADII
ncbi:ABC transporter permease [bacterium]|nr:ABC transporter permease [bacterium]